MAKIELIACAILLAIFSALMPVVAGELEMKSCPVEVEAHGIWQATFELSPKPTPNAGANPAAGAGWGANIVCVIKNAGGESWNVQPFIWQNYTRESAGENAGAGDPTSPASAAESADKNSAPAKVDSAADKNADPAKLFKPVGSELLAVRFSPPAPGAYTAEFTLRAGKGKPAILRRENFFAKASSRKGMVRLKSEYSTKLGLDNGDGLFLIGYNICWPEKKNDLDNYLAAMEKLAASGGNYTRLWLCSWGFQLETAKPGAFDPLTGWMLDRVFARADELGIRVMLCLDNFHDFVNNAAKYPYLKPNGPCAKPEDFFTANAAFAVYEKKLRYLAARYGAYSSLFAWELWNENEYVRSAFSRSWGLDDADLRDKYLLPWTARAAKRLRELDPHRHLVTSSLGNHQVWDSFWDALDLVQQHSYISVEKSRPALENDSAALLASALPGMAKTGKPCLMGEFGYFGDNKNHPLNDRDPEGLMLHNSLWASALQGWSGTAMHWWWDNYLDKRSLHSHYRALAEFLKGTDWRAPRGYALDETDARVRVLVSASGADCLLWAQDKSSAWAETLENNTRPGRLAGVKLTLEGLDAGLTRAKFFDPRKGEWLGEADAAVADGKISLPLPDFGMDIAIKLSRPGGQ